MYNKSKKTNENLYSKLLTKSISASNINNNNNENDNEEIYNTNLNKLILSKINNDINNVKVNSLLKENTNNKTNMNINIKSRSKANSISFKVRDEKKSISSSFSPKYNKVLLNKKIPNFEIANKRKSITKNYFNITKNINIINKYEKEKSVNNNYKNHKVIKNLSANITDNNNSQCRLFNIKEIEQNVSLNHKNKNKKYKNRLNIK